MPATKHAWNDVPLEQLSPLLGRKLLTTPRLMIAQVLLKKGCVVPGHEHHNEQITYILEGCLRFWLDEHADKPGDVYVDVHAGEVLLIPGGVRHRAEAIMDTLDVDAFTPPREDWLSGTDQYLRGAAAAAKK
jgi:quercetin dioxygenase-like cupin family protein